MLAPCQNMPPSAQRNPSPNHQAISAPLSHRMKVLKLVLPVVIVAPAATLLRNCRQHDRKSEPQPIKPAVSARAQAAATSTASSAETKPTQPSVNSSRPVPSLLVAASLRQRAAAVAARHRGMSKAQMADSAEMQQLAAKFSHHLSSPAFQSKFKQAVEALRSVKGMQHGSLSLDLTDVGSPKARAWLEAALSEDPQPAQDYMMKLLNGAVFEFSFDPQADQTSEGLILRPSAPATKPQNQGQAD